jgi:hypothetical protein
MPKTLRKVTNTFAQLTCELHVRSSGYLRVIFAPLLILFIEHLKEKYFALCTLGQ